MKTNRPYSGSQRASLETNIQTEAFPLMMTPTGIESNDYCGRESFFSFAWRERLKVVSRPFLTWMMSRIWEKVKPSHVLRPLIRSLSNTLLLNMFQPMDEKLFTFLLWPCDSHALLVFREGNIASFLNLLSCFPISFASFSRHSSDPSS